MGLEDNEIIVFTQASDLGLGTEQEQGVPETEADAGQFLA